MKICVCLDKKNGMMFTFFVVDLLSVAEYADGMEIPTDIAFFIVGRK